MAFTVCGLGQVGSRTRRWFRQHQRLPSLGRAERAVAVATATTRVFGEIVSAPGQGSFLPSELVEVLECVSPVKISA
jgi:hypothetical protein